MVVRIFGWITTIWLYNKICTSILCALRCNKSFRTYSFIDYFCYRIFQTLVYRDGILLSGPLSSLVQHLVPTTDYYPDQAYLFAFILSSRLFVKPHELLAKVVAVCHAQQRLGDQVSAALNPHHKVSNIIENIQCLCSMLYIRKYPTVF